MNHEINHPAEGDDPSDSFSSSEFQRYDPIELLCERDLAKERPLVRYLNVIEHFIEDGASCIESITNSSDNNAQKDKLVACINQFRSQCAELNGDSIVVQAEGEGILSPSAATKLYRDNNLQSTQASIADVHLKEDDLTACLRGTMTQRVSILYKDVQCQTPRMVLAQMAQSHTNSSYIVDNDYHLPVVELRPIRYGYINIAKPVECSIPALTVIKRRKEALASMPDLNVTSTQRAAIETAVSMIADSLNHEDINTLQPCTAISALRATAESVSHDALRADVFARIIESLFGIGRFLEIHTTPYADDDDITYGGGTIYGHLNGIVAQHHNRDMSPEITLMLESVPTGRTLNEHWAVPLRSITRLEL